MRQRFSKWSWLGAGLLLVLPALALARVGGGESYVGSGGDSSSSDGGEGAILWLLIELAIRYPAIGVPLLLVFVGFMIVKHNSSPHVQTQKAFQKREAERRTVVTPSQVEGWVAALRQKDPAFDPVPLYARIRKLFMDVQQAWFLRDLTPVRPLLSDATYQRLNSQLDLMKRQGVRDAISDVKVEDLTLIGVGHSEAFDTVHVRVRAQMRDTDVPESFTDEQARAAATRAKPESFTEVWTFVRKPGVQTKVGQDVSQGKCPNCGGPFSGGATNNCEYCGAIVNSGQYDWVLAEITQGSEHSSVQRQIEGVAQLRAQDPSFSVEVLEDRASLIFWRWITAQSHREAGELAKLAAPAYQQRLAQELAALAQQKRGKVFLECAVGGVNLLSVRTNSGREEANVEIRWSAKMALISEGQKPSAGPAVHQRWVFSLTRQAGAQTNAKTGMATSRCPNCSAPLGDTLTPTCEYCSAELASGAQDWVLESALTWEAYNGLQWSRRQAAPSAAAAAPAPGPAMGSASQGQGPGTDRALDAAERERLLAMMAAVAAADGTLDANEEKLLRMCSERWSVPWANVRYAIERGPQMFDRLIEKGTPEAEIFLKAIVEMALIDGKVDKKERQMLEAAAQHLGVRDRLDTLLRT